MLEKTIVALATPPLRSALAIVRLSGEDCFDVVSNFFSKTINIDKNNGILHGYIKDKGEIIDEVVLLFYKHPHSFTGEDSVEIISHGTPFIFNKIISLAIANGARMAERGEFTNRAYLNGKLDLIQAESINDLINAETEESKKISMMALTGETIKEILPIKQGLGDLLANIEANFDYSEYNDLIDMDFKKIVEICRVISQKTEFLIKNAVKGKIIKDGVNVAIVGKPNVGKSSLLNSLLNENKAIVSSYEGTTRDVVEGRINLGGVILNLYDTAGIRESSDYVESIGISKSKEIIEKADIILALFDSDKFDKEDNEILDLIKDKKYIKVFNKKDSVKYTKKGEILISALNNDVDALKNEILKILGIDEKDFNTPSLANEREIGLLKGVKSDLNEVIEKASAGITIDILVETIKQAYLKVLSITGEVYDFDMTKEIFSRFCLGK